MDYLDKGFAEVEFHNTGLYNLKGKCTPTRRRIWLYEFTHNEEDTGKFKAPTLRNIAVTVPYMHDGSIKTLEQAIDHYRSAAAPSRLVQTPGWVRNLNKSEFVKPIELSAQERADRVLRSLTDRTLLADPSLSDPFTPVTARAAPQTPR